MKKLDHCLTFNIPLVALKMDGKTFTLWLCYSYLVPLSLKAIDDVKMHAKLSILFTIMTEITFCSEIRDPMFHLESNKALL